MTDSAHNPLVSIIVRTKDRPKQLQRALRSIVAQTYRPLEVVLVNDGGCDLDIEGLRGILSDVSLNYVKLDENTGRAHAGNAGLELAAGEYAGFLDDDDELYRDHVSTLAAALLQGESGVVYSDARLFSQTFDAAMELVSEEDRGEFPSRDFSFDRLLIENFIPLMCLMFSCELVRSLGGFDEALDLYEDWDLLIRIGAGTTPQHIRKITAQYNIWSSELQITERTRLSGETGTAYAQIFDKHRHRMTHETIQALLRESNARLEQITTEKDRIISEKDLSIAFHIREKEALLRQKELELGELQRRIIEKDYQLSEIYNSLGWRLLSKYRSMKERLFPEGTQRRKLYDYGRRGVYVVRNEGFRSFLQRAQRRFSAEFRGGQGRRETVTLSAEIRPLTMPAVHAPRASIIIPVFNKAVYTFTCLESVLEHTGDVPYEVVIVDDASTDNTAGMLKDISNITVITNTDNAGFIAACNQGADAARGAYLVFLNNDTKVTEGWLSSLLKTFEAHEHVGIAGAKLIYPDGKLQEAGGIIWSDGTGWNYGRYDDPDKPEYTYLREVDYCSGACLAIKKELFMQAGCFDRSYAPAYYEDVDLCFTVRKMGYRVAYQPAAEVVHFEGITSGTDVGSGTKKYQEINREKFIGKWRDVLVREHLPPGKDVFFARDRSQKKPVLLFIDHYVPTYDKDAGSFVALEYLKIFLELGFKIIFWPDNLSRMQPYTSVMQQMGIEVIYGRRLFGEYMRESGRYIDVAFVSRPSIAPKYLDDIRLFSRARIFYVAVDLHFLREKRRAGISGDTRFNEVAETWKQTEIYLAYKSDVTLLYSSAEKDILLREVPQARVDVLPWIQPLNPVGKSFADRRDILFIGGFAHTPNEDAVVWFAEEILPRVKKEIPDVRFVVVGSHPTEKVRSLQSPDVVIAGFVEDVSPHFSGTRIFVSPLRYGAGFKGKNLLAMSYGLPVITTAVGAEGVAARDGDDILISDDADSFAKNVVRLYRDEQLWNRISLNSRDVVQREYSPGAGKKKALELFGDLDAVMRRRGFSAQSAASGAAASAGPQQASQAPVPGKPPYSGFCTVCGNFSRFDKNSENLRETFLCGACGSNSRNRHLAKVLCRAFGKDRITSLAKLLEECPACSIYEAQSAGAINRILKQLPGYVCSEFFEGVAPGDYRKGIRCEDLQHLTFPDNSFDMVITQDVFEHIRDPWQAFREIFRVLKPEGMHVFTIPYFQDSKTVRRVQIEGDREIYLLPKEFHGDGVRDGLVYTDFGYDILGYLASAGFSTEVVWSDETDSGENHIYWNVVFVSKK